MGTAVKGERLKVLIFKKDRSFAMKSFYQGVSCIEHSPSGLQNSGEFRSRLEALVAQEMTSLGVSWKYEHPVSLPNGRSVNYLPDFLITHSPAELQLPRWVECKPQEFLYDLRTAMGIDRAHGERFKSPIAVSDVDSRVLSGLGFLELAKPKRLSEVSGESVLVVGRVRGIETLSVEMEPEKIIFSRSHPLVNQLGIQKDKERKERLAELQRKAYARQANLAAANSRMELVARTARIRNRLNVAKVINQSEKGRNKYNGQCFGCSSYIQAGKGFLFHASVNGAGWQFYVICKDCIEAQ